MIHEHDATRYASAAMDFPLADHEDRWLQQELAECPVCTERAAAYREQLRMLQRLPAISASDATRIRITQAALSGRTDTRSPMMLALAAALLVGLLLALTAAAGALLTNRDDLSEIPTATPSPPASAPLVAASPEPSAPEVAAGGGFEDALAPDSIVEVVSDNLRVRSKPSATAADSIKYTPLLLTGDRLFVVGGPVVADDYAWYRVAPVGTDPSRPWTDLPSGWVARGDHDGTPWVAPAAPDCPALPLEISALNELHPLERLACFGQSPLSVLALIEGGSQSGWTAGSRPTGYLDATIPGMEVAVEPAPGVSPDALPDSRVAILQGAFDAKDCDDAGDAFEIASCRATFVVTDARLDPVDLARNDLAITVTDGLRVRERPVVEDAGKLELLPNGTRLAVVGGPAVASGYSWYQVVAPAIRTADGSPRVGWVAAHAKDGELWVGRDEFDCQEPSAVTIETLEALTSRSVPHGGLGCYGAGGPFRRAELTVDGHARVECSGPRSNASHWLMAREKSLVLIDGASEVRAVMPNFPDSLKCDAEAGERLYRAVGHFDDSESGACRRASVGADDPDPVAVYECRSRFVVTDVSVTGPGSSRAPGAP